PPAIVIAQHRSTDIQPHGLGGLLQRHARRPVVEAADKDPIERGCIYLAPADYHLLVEPGHFGLTLDDRVQYARPSVDVLFEPLGHRLVTATSGEQALRQLLREEFALILLDVQMPKLDGFETAELIKQRERTRDVPIIFLTAISKERGHVFRGYDTGAVDYVFKPFDPAILRSKVRVFVDLFRQRVELRRQSELLRQAALAEERRISEERYRQLADSMAQLVWTA